DVLAPPPAAGLGWPAVGAPAAGDWTPLLFSPPGGPAGAKRPPARVPKTGPARARRGNVGRVGGRQRARADRACGSRTRGRVGPGISARLRTNRWVRTNRARTGRVRTGAARTGRVRTSGARIGRGRTSRAGRIGHGGGAWGRVGADRRACNGQRTWIRRRERTDRRARELGRADGTGGGRGVG